MTLTAVLCIRPSRDLMTIHPLPPCFLILTRSSPPFVLPSSSLARYTNPLHSQKKIYIPKQSSAQNLDPGKHPDNHGPNITNQSSSWVARSPANTVVPLTTTAANTTLPAPTMTGTKSKEAIYRTDSKGSTGAVGIKRTRRDMRNRYAMQRSANGTAGH